MQIKPAWKAAGNFSIQPGCALYPAVQASSHDCFSWWLFNISLPVLSNSLWLSENMQLFLLTAQLKWIYKQKEQVLVSLSIWSKNIRKLIFFFVKMKRLMLTVSSAYGEDLEGSWGLGMDQRCCACEPACCCVGHLLRGGWVPCLMWELQEPQNIYVIALAVSAKGQLCYKNLQPF